MLGCSQKGGGLPWTEAIEWGAFLFLQTRLGRHLWDLCTDQAELPAPGNTREAVTAHGMPLPDELILGDLSLLGSRQTNELPKAELLEQELAGVVGFP